MSLIKVVWYVLRVKNMHAGSLSDPSETAVTEAKQREVPDAKSDCSRRGEAEVRILNFKTTWSEFHHLPRVGPKQLCALAHLGCTRAAGTS